MMASKGGMRGGDVEESVTSEAALGLDHMKRREGCLTALWQPCCQGGEEDQGEGDRQKRNIPRCSHRASHAPLQAQPYNSWAGDFIWTTYPDLKGVPARWIPLSAVIAQGDVEVVWCWRKGVRGEGWCREGLREWEKEGVSRPVCDCGQMQPRVY